MSTRWHEMTAFQKAERITELPLLLLAFAMIPAFVGPLLWDLTEQEKRYYYYLELGIWAVFAIDLAVKLVLAPNKVTYLRQHWVDVLIVLLPVVRPLRPIRFGVFVARFAFGAMRLAQPDYLIGYGVGAVVIAATIVASVEPAADSATIHTFGDALWWAMATVATVGYGDYYPVTVAGKFTAVFLMVIGIGIFGGIAANFASALITRSAARQQSNADELKTHQP